MVVHILIHGYPACGFTSDQPHKWPTDHKWVGLDERYLATCYNCIGRLSEEQTGLQLVSGNGSRCT